MKTRTRGEDHTHGLPPPPAPTAPDANPWEMSSAPTSRGSLPWPRPPFGKPGRLPKTGKTESPAPLRRVAWMPLLVLVFVAGTGVQLAIRALSAGEVDAAVGALVIVAFVGLIAVRRLRKKSP